MADQKGSSGIDPSVADALKQHLQVSSSMAKMGHEAMGAAHKQVVSSLGPHADILQALSGAAQGGGGGGQADSQQAVWDAFPGTDPQAVSQMSHEQFMQAAQADEAKLNDLHNQALSSSGIASGEPRGQSEPVPPPGVTGGF